ncbi:unnamed protein product [Clonostachys rosea]|uniref:Fungal N-terminal domain-containing protein n=1 Tax=Bionectria ochroleuca TaxID=29856 RepID=A0ABY6U6H9_BIOOC|nr:unnamed protein product [Clonostachys rosea]
MEVFGAVGTAISLITLARNNMGRAQRLGRTVDDLREILSDVMELQDYVDPEEDVDLLDRISRIIDEVMEMIEENSTTIRVAMTFFWNSSLEGDVYRLNAKLSRLHEMLKTRTRQRRMSNASIPNIKSSPQHSPYSPPSTVQRELLPESRLTQLHTTLVFQDSENEDVRPPLQLEWFSILEHNYVSNFRTIQYETSDRNTVVTHEVRFGTIPNTPQNLDANECDFLEEQLLTVETLTDYAVYRLDPIYKFETSRACDKFMAKVRERELVGKFLPIEISKKNTQSPWKNLCCMMVGGSKDILLARDKVVCLWEKSRGLGKIPDTTITFHDRNTRKYIEWPLRDFIDASPVMNRAVELSWRNTADVAVFTFAGQPEAREFASVFDRQRKRRASSVNLTNGNLMQRQTQAAGVAAVAELESTPKEPVELDAGPIRAELE